MKSFVESEKGTVAVVTALAVTALMMFVGMALDYSRILTARAAGQHDLDAATLAALSGNTDAEATQIANQYLSANKYSWGNVAVARSLVSGSYHVQAAGTVEIPTPFLAFAGFRTMKAVINSESAMQQTPTSAVLASTSSFGWSTKKMNIHTVSDGVDKIVFGAAYTPTDLNGAGGRGTGTTILTPADGAASFGAYSSMYMELIVQDYGGAVTTFRSDDPSTASQLYVSGQRLPTGQTYTIDQMLPCGKPVSIAWEDSLRPEEWGTQDMLLTAAPTCGATQAGARRLVR